MTLSVVVSERPLLDLAHLPATVAVSVRPGPDGAVADAGGRECAETLGVDVDALLRAEHATGDAGEVTPVLVTDGGVTRLLAVGVGDGGPAALRTAAGALARKCRDDVALVTDLARDLDADGVAVVVEALSLAAYRFVLPGKPSGAAPRVTLVAGKGRAVQDAARRAGVVADATRLARDLVNMPSLTKTPEWFARRAVEVAAASGLDVLIRDERELAAEGFGGIVAVGQGSARPPRLIELSYTPRRPSRHVVLVGKGITFDSGGLSLKTNDGMSTMKTDMAGGAAVIGAMSALRALDATVKVTGLVAAAENMISGSAQRPSDVIRQWGGRTVEVLNTDAEGRLVLADAMAYAADVHAPDAIVDIATLTGAATVALGKRDGALYSNDETLAAALLGASADAGERLWRMPLQDDYRDSLDSDVADISNIGDRRYLGGSIIAALFLREFVAGRPWAHLDVAGPARADADDAEITKGGTGFGVRTFLRWLAPPS